MEHSNQLLRDVGTISQTRRTKKSIETSTSEIECASFCGFAEIPQLLFSDVLCMHTKQSFLSKYENHDRIRTIFAINRNGTTFVNNEWDVDATSVFGSKFCEKATSK